MILAGVAKGPRMEAIVADVLKMNERSLRIAI